MSELIEETRADPIDLPDGPAPDLALSEEERQHVRATERARMKAEIDAIRTEARLEMQREIARYQRENKLTAWAQDATSPRLDRPKALPIEPQLLTSFVLALDGFSTDLSGQFQTIINRILTNDLIDFSEHGSAAGAGDEPTAKEAFDAAVAAKMGTGLTKLQAMQAVQREQPDIYEAYHTESSRRGAVAAPAKKTARKGA
jgi:hypothetical protein